MEYMPDPNNASRLEDRRRGADSERPKLHQFNPEHAEAYGLEEAVMIHGLAYRLLYKRERGENQIEGRTWIYDAYHAIQEWFPYWTERKVRRILDALAAKGVLVKCQHRLQEGDARNWYAFANEAEFLAPYTHLLKSADGVPKSADPLPKSADGVPKAADHLPNSADLRGSVSTPVSSTVEERDARAPHPADTAEAQPEIPDIHRQALRLFRELGAAFGEYYGTQPMGRCQNELVDCLEFHLKAGRIATADDVREAIRRRRQEHKSPACRFADELIPHLAKVLVEREKQARKSPDSAARKEQALRNPAPDPLLDAPEQPAGERTVDRAYAAGPESELWRAQPSFLQSALWRRWQREHGAAATGAQVA